MISRFLFVLLISISLSRTISFSSLQNLEDIHPSFIQCYHPGTADYILLFYSLFRMGFQAWLIIESLSYAACTSCRLNSHIEQSLHPDTRPMSISSPLRTVFPLVEFPRGHHRTFQRHLLNHQYRINTAVANSTYNPTGCFQYRHSDDQQDAHQYSYPQK